MNKEDIEILELEHIAGWHTSEDWTNLKDRCYGCFQIVRDMKKTRVFSTEEKDQRNDNAMSRLDYSFKNPLE